MSGQGVGGWTFPPPLFYDYHPTQNLQEVSSVRSETPTSLRQPLHLKTVKCLVEVGVNLPLFYNDHSIPKHSRSGSELPTFLQRPPHLNYKKSWMGGVSPSPLYNNHPTQNIKDDAGMGVNLHLFMITTQIKKINHLSTMNIPKPKKCVGGGGEPSPDYDDQIIEIAISITRPVNKLNCRHCSRCWPLPGQKQKQNLTHRICTAWCSAR